jgi:hypothetical protein
MKISKSLLKQLLLVSGLMTLGLLFVQMFGGAIALAQGGGAIDTSTDLPPIISQLSGGQTGLRGIVLAIVNFFLTFLGLLAIIMVIYGGFLYVSSAGNEENVNKAKKILLYAVLGIVVIIVSGALVNTILGAATTERAP